MKTIGIIGGSGFIGSYITKKFLSENYKVRVSATDISKKEKYAHLHNLKNSENLEIMPLDVRDKDALKSFAEGCEIIVHGGTPFQLDVDDPQKELFDPTVKGTENFLQIVSQSPDIKKVIFVASVAAYNTNFPMPAGGKNPQDIFTENDPPFFSEESIPYAQAKFIANQTVSDFIKEQPDLNFEITSVSPVAVMGKALSGREDSVSVGLQLLFKNKIMPNDFVKMLFENNMELAMVDVGDVAESIFKAATIYGLHGKNYLLSSESYRVSDITRMLNMESPEEKGRVVYSNALAVKDLGVEFNSPHIPLGQFSA